LKKRAVDGNFITEQVFNGDLHVDVCLYAFNKEEAHIKAILLVAEMI